MEEVSCTTSYELPVQALLEQELKQCENPHVTYETLVLRLVKRLLLQLNLPWSHVLETVRQGPCLMDEKLHDTLQKMWNRRKRPVTLDEQHCVERVLGHDHNRVGDMMKLASVLNKIADPSDVYHFFAMDGLLGDDPKRYVDVFRYGPEDVQYHHVAAVRFLYAEGHVEHPAAMKEMLEGVLAGEDASDGPRSLYVFYVGGNRAVKEIADWRRELEEKSKKKRSAEEDRAAAAKLVKLVEE
ncbi:hypothetical protein AVEN_237935-1 [Araneus ventricosus]|uniref:Uncharacterized protein n=1 Tax=Araneus ventricosus TaxID=182803 RepID=A0A4Y2V7Q7_ARAVE|nr:hypothetical protein AVEN_237935-1 [Araneus ventricosus]